MFFYIAKFGVMVSVFLYDLVWVSCYVVLGDVLGALDAGW